LIDDCLKSNLQLFISVYKLQLCFLVFSDLLPENINATLKFALFQHIYAFYLLFHFTADIIQFALVILDSVL